ncbi:hypothetical protein ACFRCG_29205 [Embleya sp. NPDC056575]|uniref:hypothetical protein n=1 Tax=unclassified Embleya TaxID=2699296 RepID=UPI00369876FA
MAPIADELRACIDAVLAAASDLPREDIPESLAQALDRLNENVTPEPAPSAVHPDVDPGRHLLTRLRYDADEARNGTPIALADDADAKIEGLANDDSPTPETVRLTRFKAAVVSGLLEEFAARLERDIRHGDMVPDARGYGRLAQDMAEYLRSLRTQD